MTEPMIRVEGLGKRYRIGSKEERGTTFLKALSSVVGSPFSYVRQMMRPATEQEIIWALKNVSFNVKSGEVVGIIGRNGSGKSTLLKILSRITDPTEGRVTMHGRVGSLLEVGTGFHPDLTGRENIYLNGAILGMKKREIENKFDEIVDFSGVEKFIDTPVKRYSSGMYVRLAFAVAAHLDPDVLVVDEVLAVGDESFRKKCVAKMSSVAREGRTIIFVSHTLPIVADLCTRAIWLQLGQLMVSGDVEDVIQAYLGSLLEETEERHNAHLAQDNTAGAQHGPLFTSEDFGFVIEKVLLRNSRGAITTQFRPGEELTVEIWFDASREIPRPYVWVDIDSPRGTCFGANMLLDGAQPQFLSGHSCLACKFTTLPLLPQIYTIRMCIRAQDGSQGIFTPGEVASFRVVGDLFDYGYESKLLPEIAKRSYPVVIPYEWLLPNGTRVQVSLDETAISRAKDGALRLSQLKDSPQTY